MRIVYLLIALLTTSIACADSTAPNPEDWYKNNYAPIWETGATDKLEPALRYYNQTIQVHEPAGELKSVTSRVWLEGSLRLWASEGWLSSDLEGFTMDQLNASTVMFKSSWRDKYANGSESITCGWYLADLQDGVWLFTNYAEIECAEHGF